MANMTFGVNLLPNNTGGQKSLGNSDQKWKIYTDSINDAAPSKLGEIPFAIGTGTAAVTTSPYTHAKWEASIPEITTLYNGLTIGYKVPVAGHATYGVGLQVNNLGYHPVITNVTTSIGTRYAVNATIMLMYNSTINGTLYLNSDSSSSVSGCWVAINDRDLNDNTTFISNLRHYNGNFIANSAIYRYQLLVHTDEDTISPFNNNNNTTAATKTILTNLEFDPFQEIYYYNSTTAVAANNDVGANACGFTYAEVNLRYSFNLTTDLLFPQSLYLKLTPTSNNKAKLASTDPLTQTLPTTKDGYWYLYLGRTYSAYQLSLYPYHPIYYHDGTRLVEIKQDLYRNNIYSQNYTIKDAGKTDAVSLQWDDNDKSLNFVFT